MMKSDNTAAADYDRMMRYPVTAPPSTTVAEWSPIPKQFCDLHTRSITPLGMVLLRLGYFDAGRSHGFGYEYVGEGAKLDIVEVRKLADHYAIFAVVNGKALVLEDDLGLFPSDALLTKINLLKG
jgi:hypothetical protein